MRSLRSMLSATIAGSTLLAATATAAHAAGRPLFTWSGTVDREAVIVMRGAMLETQGDGFESFRAARFRVEEALPRTTGLVSIARADGRGDVEVIEQPSAFNGYTARVRVRDRQSGADQYRLVVTWQEARGSRGNDDYDRRDRDDDRDRDGNRDRDRNGGRDGDRDRGGYDRNRGDDIGRRAGAGALHFSALVDDVAEIRIQGRRVDVVSRSGRRLADVRYDVRGASLPTASVPLDLRRFAGRGNVFIAQYPRAWNNWTAVIKIDDSRAGVDGYDFDLRW